jgi:hypothetical protein
VDSVAPESTRNILIHGSGVAFEVVIASTDVHETA